MLWVVFKAPCRILRGVALFARTGSKSWPCSEICTQKCNFAHVVAVSSPNAKEKDRKLRYVAAKYAGEVSGSSGDED